MAQRSLKNMVRRQVANVLARGQRLERFDQLRSRHFWSTYLFAVGAGNPVSPSPYDIFKVIPSQTGQGYPTNVPLTIRETNWLNAGRVPDNQNFVITEIGCTIKRPPSTVSGTAPTDGIFANLTAPIQALIAPERQLHPNDVQNIAYNTVLEMSFLTNNVPLGLVSDFSQSSGALATQNLEQGTEAGSIVQAGGDPTMGVPAAAFRRKLEVPILLQHGENMGMRLNVNRAFDLLGLSQGGAGWFEIRVDWWAHESFTEKS